MALSELAVTDWRFTRRGNLLMSVCCSLSWSQAWNRNAVSAPCVLPLLRLIPFFSFIVLCFVLWVFFFYCFWGSQFSIWCPKPANVIQNNCFTPLCIFGGHLRICSQPQWSPVCEECVVPLLPARCFCQEAADLQMLLKSEAARLRLLWNLFCSLLEKVWGEMRLAQRICK